MSDYTDFYVGLFTRMQRAEHCTCEACQEADALQEAWDALQAVPSYVEQQACKFAQEA